MYFTSRQWLLGLALAGAALPLPAGAAPYFAYGQGAFTVYDAGGVPQVSDLPQNGTFANSPSLGTAGAQSQTYSVPDFGVSAAQSASADLAAGQLHAAASLSQTNHGQSVWLLGEAGFGDSFTTLSSGSPFDWASGQAHFTMTLDGSATTSSLASGVRLWNVMLSILKPGSLAAGKAFDADARLGFASFINASYGGVGYLIPNATSGITIDHSGNLHDGITLDAYFNFGSDFDWTLSLGAAGGQYAGASVGDLDVDLSHTLTLGYQGPAGTTLASASGVFPGSIPATATVPEPASLALLLSGLFGVLLLHRQPA